MTTDHESTPTAATIALVVLGVGVLVGGSGIGLAWGEMQPGSALLSILVLALGVLGGLGIISLAALIGTLLAVWAWTQSQPPIASVIGVALAANIGVLLMCLAAWGLIATA